MWKKSNDFSADDLQRLMASPQAQALAQILRQMDPNTLQQAASMAAQGNQEGAKAMLSPVLKDPKIQKLLQNGEDSHG